MGKPAAGTVTAVVHPVSIDLDAEGLRVMYGDGASRSSGLVMTI